LNCLPLRIYGKAREFDVVLTHTAT
jgi:hypothetical protein